MTEEQKLGICKDCKNRCGQMCVENVSPKGEVIHCSQYKPLKNSRADLYNQLTEKDKQIADLETQIEKMKHYLNEFMRISVASVEEFEPEFGELVGEVETFLEK